MTPALLSDRQADAGHLSPKQSISLSSLCMHCNNHTTLALGNTAGRLGVLFSERCFTFECFSFLFHPLQAVARSRKEGAYTSVMGTRVQQDLNEVEKQLHMELSALEAWVGAGEAQNGIKEIQRALTNVTGEYRKL